MQLFRRHIQPDGCLRFALYTPLFVSVLSYTPLLIFSSNTEHERIYVLIITLEIRNNTNTFPDSKKRDFGNPVKPLATSVLR